MTTSTTSPISKPVSACGLRSHLPGFHALYGLRIAADFTLPGVPLLPSTPPVADLHIGRLDSAPFLLLSPDANGELLYTSGECERNGQPVLRVSRSCDGRHFDFFYSDGARFLINREASQIWADWPQGYTLEDAATYLVGPVMGFVLRLRGIVPLHASAVAIGGRAVALVGSPGAGKSTTAAAFACRGFSVLSDDLAALIESANEFLVQPGYPRLNLWPDSVSALLGSEDALPCITPTWEKRYMPLVRDGCQFASAPMPLGAIYFLHRRDPELGEAAIDELSGAEAAATLAANTYVNYLLDRDMRRHEFDVLSRVLAQIPVRRVRPTAKASAVFGLCEAIANDAQDLIDSALPATATPRRG